MGNTATSPEGDDLEDFDGIETLGYRVLGVQPDSPASKAGLVSFFDFLVGANGQMLLGSGEGLEDGEEYDDVDFPALLLANKGKPVELLVWNIKCQQQRLVELVPDDSWGGAGLLGVTIKLDNYGGAEERLVRVLSVEPQSPANIAGLVPELDYLLGTTVSAFSDAQALAQVLRANLDKIVEIYVYNADSDVVRVVALLPTYSWGNGNGLLGAEVGTGYLHKLPKRACETIGTSVERKVRWTGSADDSGQEAGSSSQPQAPLEMEPHLEMEVGESSDSEVAARRPEDSMRQPHELGTPDRKSEPVQRPKSPPTHGEQKHPVVHPDSPLRGKPSTKAEAEDVFAHAAPSSASAEQ